VLLKVSIVRHLFKGSMMSKLKLFAVGVMCLLVLVGAVLAGTRAVFDNPRVTVCNLDTLSVSGTLRISETVYVEEYIEGKLNTTFTGSAGAYSGYVSYFEMSSYPYSWKFLLSFKNNGTVVEQYAIEGSCTAEDVGTVTFKEVQLESNNSLNLS
jgi:hypothetical protein